MSAASITFLLAVDVLTSPAELLPCFIYIFRYYFDSWSELKNEEGEKVVSTPLAVESHSSNVKPDCKNLAEEDWLKVFLSI